MRSGAAGIDGSETLVGNAPADLGQAVHNMVMLAPAKACRPSFHGSVTVHCHAQDTWEFSSWIPDGSPGIVVARSRQRSAIKGVFAPAYDFRLAVL